MALGFLAADANTILDNKVTAGDFDYIQLHTGDPGAAGTANVAGNNTRKAVSWNSASGGSITNSADIEWTDAEVDTAETYDKCSFWDAVTAGNFKMSGELDNDTLAASGEGYKIPAGALSISLNVAA